MAPTPYDIDLDRNPANFQPLTPLTFLERAAASIPDRTAIIHGRAAPHLPRFLRPLPPPRLGAGAARASGAATRSRSCSPTRRPCSNAITACRWRAAVLNTLNTRLDAAIIAFSLDHGEAKVLITDREFSKTIRPALAQAQGEAARHRLRRSGILRRRRAPRRDRVRGLPRRGRSGLRLGDAARRVGRDRAQLHLRARPATRRASSTTIAAPTCSRIGNVVTCGMGKHPVYLWTLPMFHCNGWCFPWSISIVAGTHVCLRQVRAEGDVRRPRRPRRHASVRRADRDVDAAQRAGAPRSGPCRTRSSSSPPPRRRRRRCSPP